MECVGGVELLISEITGSVLAYSVSNIMVSTTQTLAQIKSQEYIGHIKQHFTTASSLTYVTNCIQWGFLRKGKEMFYLTTHWTHFIYGYIASDHMVKNHSDRERGNPLPPHRLLFSISSKGSFICIIPQDNTYHGLCYTSCGALAGTRNSPMGPPWRIDPTTHRTMSERSYHGATSRSFFFLFFLLNAVSIVGCTSAFDPTTRCLVDYNLQESDSSGIVERRGGYILLPVTSSLAIPRYQITFRNHSPFYHGKSVRSWCDGSSDRTHWAISRSSQCSTTGVTKVVVCVILSVGWCI